MTGEPTNEELLRAMAKDENVQPSVRLAALKELRGIRGESPERSAPGDPQAAMRALVQRLCPEPGELEGSPPDPLRDLDAAEQLRLAGSGRTVDPLIWTWLPYCPERVAHAERQVLQAVRRLGVGPGPFEAPGAPGDELAERRARR